MVVIPYPLSRVPSYIAAARSIAFPASSRREVSIWKNAPAPGRLRDCRWSSGQAVGRASSLFESLLQFPRNGFPDGNLSLALPWRP